MRGFYVALHLVEHKTQIPGYKSLKKLAEDVGDLRYDALADFLGALSEKLFKDALDDRQRGRLLLSATLFDAANGTDVVKKNIKKAWRISQPRMGQKFDLGDTIEILGLEYSYSNFEATKGVKGFITSVYVPTPEYQAFRYSINCAPKFFFHNVGSTRLVLTEKTSKAGFY